MTVERLGTRFDLSNKNVVLAFDYTEEDFYGDVQGFWIHGYTGEHGVTGKFKFLTCAIINSDIPQKIPLISHFARPCPTFLSIFLFPLPDPVHGVVSAPTPG
jgi:hypothetical protein